MVKPIYSRSDQSSVTPGHLTTENYMVKILLHQDKSSDGLGITGNWEYPYIRAGRTGSDDKRIMK